MLTIDDCKDTLDTEFEISCDIASDGNIKRFTKNTWSNVYVLWHASKRIDSDQQLYQLLNRYNEL